MDDAIQTSFNQLDSDDREVQHRAFMHVMQETEKPVDWAYQVWDKLVADLSHKNNRVRAIAGQLLCNLAKSDPKNRIQKDFAKLLAVTKDERFVTARHTLQSLWKVGAVGKSRQKLVVEGLADRFRECRSEKNCSLIRYDILEVFRKLYDRVSDVNIKTLALDLMETEEDLKYRKKYATLWKKA